MVNGDISETSMKLKEWNIPATDFSIPELGYPETIHVNETNRDCLAVQYYSPDK